MEQQAKSNPVRQEQQGPAGFQQGGPAAGYTLEELGQPTRSQNAEAVMQQHQEAAKAKRHPQ